MVLLIGGGFVDGTARTTLWLLVVAVILGSMMAAASGAWIVRAGHFAERHGLIVIIALGEIVVAIGVPVVNSLEEGGLPGETLAGLVSAGVLAGLLWWSYFDRVLPALEHRAEGLPDHERPRYARDVYTWAHIPIVSGIIATAAASEEILLHPNDEVPGEYRIMLAIGLLLFLGGAAAAVARAFHAFAVERAAACTVIVGLAIVASSWPGLALLIAVSAVLTVMLVAEHLRIEGPREEAA